MNPCSQSHSCLSLNIFCSIILVSDILGGFYRQLKYMKYFEKSLIRRVSYLISRRSPGRDYILSTYCVARHWIGAFYILTKYS